MVYEPEIGQMLFGQPYKQHDLPEIMDSALTSIRNEMDRVMWNLFQKNYENPFGNSGASFRCEVFTVCSYSWNDELWQPYNFKHEKSGTLISWYKYHGRGMSANKHINPDLASDILMDCLLAMRKIEKGEMGFDEPGLYPDGSLEQKED